MSDRYIKNKMGISSEEGYIRKQIEVGRNQTRKIVKGYGFMERICY